MYGFRGHGCGHAGLIALGITVRYADVNLVEVVHGVDLEGLLDAFVVLLDGMAAEYINDVAVRVHQDVYLEIQPCEHGNFLHVFTEVLILEIAYHVREGGALVQEYIAEHCFVVQIDCVKPSDTGQDYFSATAEAGGGMRDKPADADAQVVLHELGIDLNAEAAACGADMYKVFIWVVVEHRILTHYVPAELFRKVVILKCAVHALGAKEKNLVFGNAGFEQFFKDDVCGLLAWGAAAHVVEQYYSVALANCELGD